MLISMSMLKWYLQDPHLEHSLQSDSPTMRSIRFMSENMHALSSEFAYVGNGDNFFSDERYAAGSIIVCGNSYLYSFKHDREDMLNKTLDAFDFFNNWEKRLLKASADHAPLQEMASIAVEALDNPILIVSRDGEVLAHDEHGMRDDGDTIWNGIAASGRPHVSILENVLYTPAGTTIDVLDEKPQIVENVNAGFKPIIMQGVIVGEEQLGYVAVRLADESLADMDMQLMSALSGFLKNAHEFTSAGMRTRPSADFVKDAIEGRDLHPDAVLRFEQAIIDPPYRLIAFSHVTRKDTLAVTGCRRAIASLGIPCMLVEQGDVLLALIRARDFRVLLDSLSAVIDTSSWRIGTSTLLSGITAAHAGMHQIEFCLERLEGRPGLVHCDDMAFSYLVEMLKSNPLAASFTHPALGQLMRHDSENASSYYETLRTYVYNGRNLDRASKALHVHRNTLKYRMRIIRELTGIDTNDAEEMQYLHLSLKLTDE